MKDHKKSKSTSAGIQVSPGAAIPGTASFAHNKRDARTKHLPTISQNTDVETQKDISGMNRDADNTSKKTKDSKTHVEGFIPLMNPMDAPKLWDKAADNAKGIADKPLMTPPQNTPKPLPAFLDQEDQDRARERKRAVLTEIINVLREQGATPEEVRTILYDESMKDLINRSCGRANTEQTPHVRGKPLEITITEGYSDPLDRCLGIVRQGAETLSDLAEKHPTLTSFSLTAIQLALGGPAGYARDMVCESIGVQDAVDEVTNAAKGWFSNELQDRLGVSKDNADIGAEAGYFGVILGFGAIGGASKEKILEAAKGVKEKVGRVRLINNRKPINSEFAGGYFSFDKLPEDVARSLKNKYPHGVPFTGTGYPDFSRYARNKVQLSFSGNTQKDIRSANKIMGYKGTPEGFTWHHSHDGSTMMLIPFDLHAAVKHTGGAALARVKK